MRSAMTAGLALTSYLANGLCFAHSGIDEASVATGPRNDMQPTYSMLVGIEPASDMLSPYRMHPGVLDIGWLRDWKIPDSGASALEDEVRLGYAWRNLKLEGTVTSGRRESDRYAPVAPPKKLFTATVGRISYRSATNWTFQISRGRLNRPDLMDSEEEIRHTSIAASYSYPFQRNNWQTVMAFGRSAKKADGSSGNGYLFESSIHLGSMHTLFGRVERASADELFTDRDALHGQNFNANRTTFGYVYAMPIGSRSQMAFGGVVARRSMPQEAVSVLGGDSPSYKVFMHISLQMP